MRRARKNAFSQNSATVIEMSHLTELTAVFVTTVPTDSVSKISRRQLYNFLETLIPEIVKEVHGNSRKNVLAVDASTPTVVSTLFLRFVFCVVTLRWCLPRGRNAIEGVIQGVHNGIPDSYLVDLVLSTTAVIKVRRFGT